MKALTVAAVLSLFVSGGIVMAQGSTAVVAPHAAAPAVKESSVPVPTTMAKDIAPTKVASKGKKNKKMK